ncbi:MAG: formate--tetrahydrofolate ligase [Rhodospirillales bacterium]|nr:formate--tetrahydrofolate ligase [Rhodospirillales bacterium]
MTLTKAFLPDIAPRPIALKPIEDVAAGLGIPGNALYRYGPFKGKVTLDFATRAASAPVGKLILVTAISPTPAGEGKTTTTIGLGDALRRAGHRTAICLREPSLGPSFGAKGGATGGGQAQIAPIDEINLHFTGDMHAIGAAHNLLAAMIDNHLHWGNALGLDPASIAWRRVIDLNDRALRDVVIGLGSGNGVVRQTGFDITAASEVMAIFCLSRSLVELEQRLGDIVIGHDKAKRLVRARELNASGAMAALLKDAFAPNLVQTLEGTPAFVHGGPFANIAHGCNTLLATQTALGLADFVVTEAGFGADLGAEKFLDIKCRLGGFAPAVCVIVATVRALKMHGGVALRALGEEDAQAVAAGCANLLRHVGNMRKFGLNTVVAINQFAGDTAAELEVIQQVCAESGVRAISCEHFSRGGEGAIELAEAVSELAEASTAFEPLYPDAMPLEEKISTIAKEIYGATGITLESRAAAQLRAFTEAGFANLPVCMAKTQYSFSSNPALRGVPSGFTLPIREIRLSAGAGFIVALCGDTVTMPGLPRHAAAETIFLNSAGDIEGLS